MKDKLRTALIEGLVKHQGDTKYSRQLAAYMVDETLLDAVLKVVTSTGHGEGFLAVEPVLPDEDGRCSLCGANLT